MRKFLYAKFCADTTFMSRHCHKMALLLSLSESLSHGMQTVLINMVASQTQVLGQILHTIFKISYVINFQTGATL